MSSLSIIFAQRIWQAVAGLVTAVMITRFLTPSLQGWYYSFLGISALHTLFDLGLSIVLTQFAAHSVARRQNLSSGVREQEDEYFHSLVNRSARNYLILAVFFFILVLVGGLIFFSRAEHHPANWQWAWLCLVLSVAFNLVTLPFLAIIEGAGKIGQVYSIKLAQGFLGSLLCWWLILQGEGLWATVASPLMAAIVQPIWLILCWRSLLKLALRKTRKQPLSWQREIWPLQWRVGASWLSGYLLTQVYTPLLFATRGAAEAGKMGLSLTIANMLGLIAFSAVTRNVPTMAHAAALRKWREMDRLFFGGLKLSAGAYSTGATLILIALAQPMLSSFADRLLPLCLCAILLGSIFLSQLSAAFAAHLRSYRKEPLVWLNVVASVLTISGAALLVPRYGSAGIVTVLLGVQSIIVLPLSLYIWRRFHRNWRATA